MSGTWAMLGPLGYLTQIPDVQAGIGVASARASSEIITLGGVRHVQYGARGPRSWTVAHVWCTPDQVAYLTACSSGAVAGPLYLYTQDAARVNLLPAHLAAPGAGGDTALGSLSASNVLVSGMGPMAGVASAAAAGVWSQTIPVQASVPLSLSCWAGASASMTSGATVLQWQTVNAAGVQVATGNVTTTAAGATARATGTLTPSSTAVGVQVRVAATTGRTITALRLTEGTPTDTSWLPGVGAVQVAVDDPAQTIQAVWASQIRSDYTWTLREVG